MRSDCINAFHTFHCYLGYDLQYKLDLTLYMNEKNIIEETIEDMGSFVWGQDDFLEFVETAKS